MQIQGNQRPAVRRPRRTGSRHAQRWRRRNNLRYCPRRRARRVLIRERKLRRWRNHGSAGNVDVSQTRGNRLHIWWRRDDCRLRRLKFVARRCGDVRRRRHDRGLHLWQIAPATQPPRVRWRRNHGIFHLWRNPRQAGSWNQRRGRNRHRRLFPPRHNVGQRHIALHPHIRRGDNRLPLIVRFARHGNYWLRRSHRIGLLRFSGIRAQRIKRRKIFRRLVVDHLIAVKACRWHSERLCSQPVRKQSESSHHDDVIPDRFRESPPRQVPLHKHVRPKRRRCRVQPQRSKFRRMQQIP